VDSEKHGDVEEEGAMAQAGFRREFPYLVSPIDANGNVKERRWPAGSTTSAPTASLPF
jgi:hypothetical protein